MLPWGHHPDTAPALPQATGKTASIQCFSPEVFQIETLLHSKGYFLENKVSREFILSGGGAADHGLNVPDRGQSLGEVALPHQGARKAVPIFLPAHPSALWPGVPLGCGQAKDASAVFGL